MELMTIRSGSNANCIYIKKGHYGILIDAGAGVRTVCTALEEAGGALSRIAAIFITHEHIDHIRGLCTLTRRHSIPIFANAATLAAVAARMPELDTNLLHTLPTGSDAVCPDMKVTSFRTSHDAVESVGYTVTDGCRRISVATDLGVVTGSVLESIRRSDMVVLESNYDEEMLRNGLYPPMLKRRILSENGHLSNSECAVTAAALVQAGTTRLMLGHLSQNNNIPSLALEATVRALEERKIRVGQDVALEVASRMQCSKLTEV